MGIATFLIAFVPTYASIGIWGAVILTVLRMIQGIGVGGEWGGSVLLAMEWSRTHGHRGLVASWPQFGVPCGLFLSNLAVLAFQRMVRRSVRDLGLAHSVRALDHPGRRRPVDSPRHPRDAGVPAAPRQEQNRAHAHLRGNQEAAQARSSCRRSLRMAEQAPFYIFTAFIFAYAVGTLHMSRDFILTAVLVASCVSFVTIPLSGHISDRIGRRKMYMIGAAVTGLFGFLYFGMVDTAIPSVVFIAIVLSLIPHDMQYGPQAALIAEAFTPRLRYSGASLGYQLASIIAGGPAPLIATALFAALSLRLRDRDLHRGMRRRESRHRQPSCLTTRARIFQWNTMT